VVIMSSGDLFGEAEGVSGGVEEHAPAAGVWFDSGAAPLEGLRSDWDDAVVVVGPVHALAFALKVVSPVGLEVVVGADRS
jgi:hypothetical protein